MNTERISLAGGGTMILFAVATDVVQFLLMIPLIGLLLNSFISIVAAMGFGLAFSHYDMSLMSPDRVLGFGATIVGEVVPAVDAIPFWTFLVARTVVSEWRRPEEI